MFESMPLLRWTAALLAATLLTGVLAFSGVTAASGLASYLLVIFAGLLGVTAFVALFV
jgi:hypothetical protein